MPVPEYFRTVFCTPQVLKVVDTQTEKKTLRADTAVTEYRNNSIDLFQ